MVTVAAVVFRRLFDVDDRAYNKARRGAVIGDQINKRVGALEGQDDSAANGQGLGPKLKDRDRDGGRHSAGIRGTFSAVLTTGVDTSDGNTPLLGGNLHDLARDKPINASTGSIHRLKSNAVKGTCDTVRLLGQDLLDGIGGVKHDWDSADGLSEVQTIRHLIHGVDARSTTQQGRIGGEETHGSGTEDGDGVPRLKPTVRQCMPAGGEDIGYHQVVHLLGEVASLVVIGNWNEGHVGKGDTGILGWFDKVSTYGTEWDSAKTYLEDHHNPRYQNRMREGAPGHSDRRGHYQG